MDNYITVAVFSYPSEYIILEHQLKEAGIKYTFNFETTQSIIPLPAHAMGGIPLKVHPSDYEKATEILKTFSNTHFLKKT